MKDGFRRFLIHFLTTVLRGLTPQKRSVQALAGSATISSSASGALTMTLPSEYIHAADYATGTDAASIEKRYTIIRRLYERYKRIAEEINRLDGARVASTKFCKSLHVVYLCNPLPPFLTP